MDSVSSDQLKVVYALRFVTIVASLAWKTSYCKERNIHMVARRGVKAPYFSIGEILLSVGAHGYHAYFHQCHWCKLYVLCRMAFRKCRRPVK
jgi:hypothetical protein